MHHDQEHSDTKKVVTYGCETHRGNLHLNVAVPTFWASQCSSLQRDKRFDSSDDALREWPHVTFHQLHEQRLIAPVQQKLTPFQ